MMNIVQGSISGRSILRPYAGVSQLDMNEQNEDYLASTFSIAAYDPEAQEWGVAVESRAFVVGAIVPWAQAGTGAVATQAHTNMSYGPRGLALLKRGYSPREVIRSLTSSDPERATRQLGLVDARGRTGNYTGSECSPWAGGIAERNFTVQGNILTGERVVKQMAKAFKRTKAKLARRLLASLEAGQAAGGDRRGQQSAALLVVRARSDIDGRGDRYLDLRVDDHPTPIAELRRLLEVWEASLYPQIELAWIAGLERRGQKARARRALRHFLAAAERIARRNPRNANMFNSLAWSLAERSHALDAALKYAKLAVKLGPDNPDILDTLAEVHFRRGEYMKALVIERPLAARNPENADLKKQLAKFEKAARRR